MHRDCKTRAMGLMALMRPLAVAACAAAMAVQALCAHSTPANRIGMARYYERFLSKSLNACTTCHLPLAKGKSPDSLADFPHNPFGKRLAELGDQLRSSRSRSDIATRLRLAANKDSDGDGVDNLSELLLGHSPGDKSDVPTAAELRSLPQRRAAFSRFLATYRWKPFESVHRPAVPNVPKPARSTNPIDAFLSVDLRKRGLQPVPEASRITLLRRVTLDLTGLSPTPAEISAFRADRAPGAYDRLVSRLLDSPRYGERWARHWMDIWRYSDWAGWADGNQVRDSKPFIWRWRDWIVESLNSDNGYDRMLQEMLAADELCPDDPSALRATGFLARNFKLLSREQWLEDTVNHTSRAFLGLTIHCAKCHNHMVDPISQVEYYRMRAIFEPHNVRTDRLPGQPDVTKDGLVRAFDAEPSAVTYLYIRGDERNPDKSRQILPGVPAALGGNLDITPVALPRHAVVPDRRPFIIEETRAAAQKAVSDAEATLHAMSGGSEVGSGIRVLARKVGLARTRHRALLAVLAVEDLEESGKKGSAEWTRLAQAAVTAQRDVTVKETEEAVLDAQAEVAHAKEKAGMPAAKSNSADEAVARAEVDVASTRLAGAEKARNAAISAQSAPITTAYSPRGLTVYPDCSTGRRLAFARWLTDPSNPLCARVAVNHIWARHFGTGLVPSVSDFGGNGQSPTHPELLDWLASELMARKWSMKDLHRLIVTSEAYRRSSASERGNAKLDPDDKLLWRFPSKRMEAECVRDNILYVSGHLDETRGGPDIDHALGLTSRRRSIYLRTAAEKQAQFLQVFDGPSVTECYERRQTVMPQQALALANSELTQRESALLAAEISRVAGSDDEHFIREAFLRVLARPASSAEVTTCRQFLSAAAPMASTASVPAAVSPVSAAASIRRAPSAKPGAATVHPAMRAGSQTAAADPAVAQRPDRRNVPPESAVLRPGSEDRQTFAQRRRQNLVLVLFNHNDFVTIR